jgi:hypothetical protein
MLSSTSAQTHHAPPALVQLPAGVEQTDMRVGNIKKKRERKKKHMRMRPEPCMMHVRNPD